jgi:DNA ligase D-like protein (predicted ligase)
MEALAVAALPEGSGWVYEFKLDGYRAIAVRSGARDGTLFSRRRNNISRRFPHIVEALHTWSEGTVVDGEIVALDDEGRPRFNFLQNYRSHAANTYFYIFDLLCFQNRDLTKLPLTERRELLSSVFESFSPAIRKLDYLEVPAQQILATVKKNGLEGVVAKRRDSMYEIGRRSGSWVKLRVNQGQEFVVGGYVPGKLGVDAIIVGYYQGRKLMYAAKVKNGFVPQTRRQVMEALVPLTVVTCPFVNLPESKGSRWGEGLDTEGMRKCVWVKPRLVAQVNFLEWTEGNHLRHARFVGLRDDKDSRKIEKEGG